MTERRDVAETLENLVHISRRLGAGDLARLYVWINRFQAAALLRLLVAGEGDVLTFDDELLSDLTIFH